MRPSINYEALRLALIKAVKVKAPDECKCKVCNAPFRELHRIHVPGLKVIQGVEVEDSIFIYGSQALPMLGHTLSLLPQLLLTPSLSRFGAIGLHVHSTSLSSSDLAVDFQRLFRSPVPGEFLRLLQPLPNHVISELAVRQHLPHCLHPAIVIIGGNHDARFTDDLRQ